MSLSSEGPHPNPSPEGEGLSRSSAKWTLRDQAKQTNSPPLQGRGRGWGLSAARGEEIGNYARDMRNQPTEPEARLWRVLSNSQLGGYKFRRQSRIGSFIADFLCPKKGLIVEVDGQTHVDSAADMRRTAQLEALGYKVVRVTNEDVMRNIDGVRRYLLDALDGLPDRRASCSYEKPHPNPSPEGEGP